MTSYYENVQRANKFINGEIEKLVSGKQETISYPHLLLRVVDTFPVGEKVVKKRISLLSKIHSGIRFVDDEIFYVGED